MLRSNAAHPTGGTQVSLGLGPSPTPPMELRGKRSGKAGHRSYPLSLGLSSLTHLPLEGRAGSGPTRLSGSHEPGSLASPPNACFVGSCLSSRPIPLIVCINFMGP